MHLRFNHIKGPLLRTSITLEIVKNTFKSFLTVTVVLLYPLKWFVGTEVRNRTPNFFSGVNTTTTDNPESSPFIPDLGLALTAKFLKSYTQLKQTHVCRSHVVLAVTVSNLTPKHSDSFVCATWLIHMCDMTHSRVFVCATWLIRTCDMTQKTWPIRMCDVTIWLI